MQKDRSILGRVVLYKSRIGIKFSVMMEGMEAPVEAQHTIMAKTVLFIVSRENNVLYVSAKVGTLSNEFIKMQSDCLISDEDGAMLGKIIPLTRDIHQVCKVMN